MPTFVKIKGFCEYADFKTKGVTRLQAFALMTTLTALLPQEIQPHVKEAELRGARSYMIKVPITPKYLVEIANT